MTDLKRLNTAVAEFNKWLSKADHHHVENQTPKYAVITCSDSRVDLAHLLWDNTYDEIFGIENAGNHVWLENMWTVSYALEHLNVELLLVLWHSTCGACNYAFNTRWEKAEKHLDIELAEIKWLAMQCDSEKELEIKNVQMQVEKLKAEFPDYIDRIWWAYYDLEEKKVYPVVDWVIK